MKKHFSLFIVLFSFLFLLTGCGNDHVPKRFLGINLCNAKAYNESTGVYNLTPYLTDDHTICALLQGTGDSSNTLSSLENSLSEDGNITLPVTWLDYSFNDTEESVFYFDFLLTGRSEDVYSLYIPAITCGYECYLNDVRIVENGFDDEGIHTYPRSVIYTFCPSDSIFHAEDGNFRLSLRLGHTDFGAQSIPASICIGQPMAIYKLQSYYLSFFSFIVFICLLTTVYQLIFFIYRNHHKVHLAFAGVVFTGGCALMLMGDSLLAFLVPNMISTAGRRTYLGALLSFAVATFLYFLYSIKTRPTKAQRIRILSILITVMVVICALPPRYVYFSQCMVAILFVMLSIWLLVSASSHIEADRRVQIRLRITLFAFVVLNLAIALILIIGIDQYHSFMVPLILMTTILLHYFLESMEYQQRLTHAHRISINISETIHSIDNYETALSSTQMKPDFVYKTFDLISDMCDKDREVAEDMTLALAKYLRMTLDYSRLSGLVTLQNEIDLVKAFVNIKKHSVSNVKVEYFMPTQLPSVMIPPMTIMPLIENAYLHAFPDGKDGKILLAIVPGPKVVTITVTDDGVGIPEDKIDNITEFAGSANIGINHIDYSLKKTYGKGLTFRTAKDKGTSISFTVPNDFIGKEAPAN